jgi:ubiquinone/menaquinone biosynthesis C-methylase UbiE
MDHAREKILAYWNDPDVASMYDKHLLNAEIELIKRRLTANAKILDAGCGEGEGTLAYSDVPGVLVHAVDFSDTRLAMARQRLSSRDNVVLSKMNFLDRIDCDSDYDFIVSQRFLINLPDWLLQQKVLLELMRRLKRGGRLLMLEGSRQGNDALNDLRVSVGQKPILERSHNVFFDDDLLVNFMRSNNYPLIEQDGLGTYFMLTRGVRPLLDSNLNWDCEFNRLAARPVMADQVGFTTKFSRLKLFVFGN